MNEAMKKLTLLMMSLCLFLSACATNYQGRMPNLDLKGAEAEQEFRNFHLNDDFWDQALWYEMGSEKNKYYVDSLVPVMSHVSPEAKAKLQEGIKVRVMQDILQP